MATHTMLSQRQPHHPRLNTRRRPTFSTPGQAASSAPTAHWAPLGRTEEPFPPLAPVAPDRQQSSSVTDMTRGEEPTLEEEMDHDEEEEEEWEEGGEQEEEEEEEEEEPDKEEKEGTCRETTFKMYVGQEEKPTNLPGSDLGESPQPSTSKATKGVIPCVSPCYGEWGQRCSEGSPKNVLGKLLLKGSSQENSPRGEATTTSPRTGLKGAGAKQTAPVEVGRQATALEDLVQRLQMIQSAVIKIYLEIQTVKDSMKHLEASSRSQQ
ncbi:hypothetical protein JRQ81_005414 [Phrynocephalus forsythii]|uniref:Uncharacterized protein n=1 Tax=Phrynocephalus forsythii TaxID=171643 RepID=A0A9Q1B6R8_9SAUR|nr:hypothetical protein JRQ81_005414 [Phrynocephalus forsythii]